MEHWSVWLADRSEDILPAIRSTGTQTPIPSTWRSPFLAASLQDVVMFLRGLPEDVHEVLDPHYFVILDANYFASGCVTACKVGDGVSPGEILTSMPVKPEDIAVLLGGQQSGQWEDYLERCMEFGGPVYDWQLR